MRGVLADMKACRVHAMCAALYGRTGL